MGEGWFDAFRDGSSPTFYGENRTAVTEDVILVALYVIFLMFMFAFLVILPGIRKERFKTFFAVTVSLFVGTVILVCLHGSNWHVGEASITSPYQAYTDRRIAARLGVKIGLNSFNVTLRGSFEDSRDRFYYNERVSWSEVEGTKRAMDQALSRGLPFPILTVTEYLSSDKEGFVWGRCYRNAGYYSYILLWTSFTVWLVSNILFCMVIRYGAYSLVLAGVLLLITNGLYTLLLPKFQISVHFEGTSLAFAFGWCFWLVLCTGILCILVGTGVALTDVFYPQRLTIIFEMDQEERKRRQQGSRRRSSTAASRDGRSNSVNSRGSIGTRFRTQSVSIRSGSVGSEGHYKTSQLLELRQRNQMLGKSDSGNNGFQEPQVVVDIGTV